MRKAIVGVVAGLTTWIVVGSAAGVVLRAMWPDYVIAASTMAFSLGMQVARLSIGALATFAMGVVVGVIARSNAALLIAGGILVLAFIPVHVTLWNKFPLWYHLTFLLSLVPLTYAGGVIADASSARRRVRRGGSTMTA